MRKIIAVMGVLLILTACQNKKIQPNDISNCWNFDLSGRAGGWVILEDDRLYFETAFDRCQLLEQTSDRLVFRLEYDSVRVANHVLQAALTITSETSKLLNRADLVLRSSSVVEDESLIFLLGAGIYLHDSLGVYTDCDQCGMITCAVDEPGDTLSDTSFPHHRRYMAVLTPGRSIQRIVDNTLISVQPRSIGDTLTYFFGASDNQESDEEWIREVAEF